MSRKSCIRRAGAAVAVSATLTMGFAPAALANDGKYDQRAATDSNQTKYSTNSEYSDYWKDKYSQDSTNSGERSKRTAERLKERTKRTEERSKRTEGRLEERSKRTEGRLEERSKRTEERTEQRSEVRSKRTEERSKQRNKRSKYTTKSEYTSDWEPSQYSNDSTNPRRSDSPRPARVESPRPAETTSARRAAATPRPAETTSARRVTESPRPAATTSARRVAATPRPAETTSARRVAATPRPTVTTSQSVVARSPQPTPTTTRPVARASTSPAAQPRTSPPPTRSTAAQQGDTASRIFELTNEERRKAGLQPLRRNDCLTSTAQNWSSNMSSQQRMYHSNLGTWMRGCSLGAVGENVAYGGRTPEQTVQMWMNSPGHRANILGDFKEVGIGFDPNGNYATQAFGA